MCPVETLTFSLKLIHVLHVAPLNMPSVTLFSSDRQGKAYSVELNLHVRL